MIDEKDIQLIGTLLDQKLKENNTLLRCEFEQANQALRSEIKENSVALRNEIKEGNASLKRELKEELADEIVVEISEIFGGTLTTLESNMEYVKEELAKRPTREEIFSWADRRLVDLEIGKERHDYLHIEELGDLPSPAEINRVLIERGIKQKLA